MVRGHTLGKTADLQQDEFTGNVNFFTVKKMVRYKTL